MHIMVMYTVGWWRNSWSQHPTLVTAVVTNFTTSKPIPTPATTIQPT
jgi:hypothetical protein